MRPVEFSADDIIKAGSDLQAAGRNITGFALRQRVGGGNPSRLKQVWDEHLAGQAEQRAEPVAELPVEVAEEVAAVTKALTERLAALAVELNDKAVKAAERRVAEVIRTAGEQREQAERELADASQTVEDLEAQLDATKEEQRATQERLAEALVTNQAQAVELAQVRERLAAVEQSARTAADQYATEVTRLNAGIEAAQAEVGRLKQANQAQAVELAQVHERLTLTERAVKTAEEQHAAELARLNASIEGERAHYKQEGEQIRAEIAEHKQAVKAAVADRDQVRAELATNKAEIGRLTDQIKDQKTRSVEVIGRLEEGKQKMEAELTEIRRESRELSSNLGKALGELEALRTQVASQQDVIKGFTTKGTKRGES